MPKMKVGLVGAGHIAVTHLKAWLRAQDCRVDAIFDTQRHLAEARARQFGIEHVVENLESLVASSDVVDVCTPPHTHAPIARQVIAADRHLLIEKPVVTQLTDWEAILDLLDHHAVKLAVIHNLKFARAIQTAKVWIERGHLGRLVRLTRQFLTDAESDRMLIAARHWSHQLPGGRWFETLPHALYLIHYLVGPLELDHVAALQTPHAPPGARADEVVITLRNSQCLATIHYSANCKLNRRNLVLHGTKGMATVDVLSDAATISRRRDDRWLRAGAGSLIDIGTDLLRWVPDRAEYLVDRLRGVTPHARLIETFALHLKGKASNPTPLDEIDYVVRNCDRIGREIDSRIRESRSRPEFDKSGQEPCR